jgi:outer membrane protein assembly factor BamB
MEVQVRFSRLSKIFAATVLAALILISIFTPNAAWGAAASNTVWSQQTVDTGGSFGPISLAVDAQNNPHVVYNGQNGMMYHASWDGQKWIRQNVIQRGNPDQLVLDAQGNPIILYKSQDDSRYIARWNGQNWNFQAVPDGCRFSIALDSSGMLHLAFTQQLPTSEVPKGVTNNLAKLNYATLTGSDWNIQTVDSSVSYTDGVYLAFDSQNIAHIMYGYDTYYPELNGGFTQTVKFAVQQRLNWKTQDALADLDNYSNMIIDSKDQEHFSYSIQHPNKININRTVGYATWDGTTAKTEVAVYNVSLSMFATTDLAIDRQDNPRIEFFNGSLMQARKTGSTWSIETVAPDRYAYSEGPIALDSNGNPYICYWVDDIHNTEAFTSQLLITSTLPLAATELPEVTPTSATSGSVTELWSFRPACPEIRQSTLKDGRLYFLTTYREALPMALYCLDASTGRQIWNNTADSDNCRYIQTYMAADGRIYIGGTLPGIVTCLEAATGAFLWNYSSGGTGIGSLTVSNGVLYAGGDNYAYASSGSRDNGIIVALNASTGDALWSYIAPSQTSFNYNNLIVKEGVVYAVSAFLSDLDSSWQGTVIALEASSGRELWNYTALSDFTHFTMGGQLLYLQSTYSDNTNYVNVKNVNGKIYQGGVTALNIADGKEAWNYRIDDSINSLSVSNGTVYAVSDGGNVYAFDAHSGHVNWHRNAGISLGNLIDADNYLYVGSTAGVYCIDKTNGNVIWVFAENSYAMSDSTIPTLADGVIYVGWNGPTNFAPAIEHNIYTLNAMTGQKLWNYTLPNTIANEPIVSDGVIYIGGDYVTTRSLSYMEPATFYAIEASVTQQNSASNGLLIPALVIAIFVAFLCVMVIKRRSKKST